MTDIAGSAVASDRQRTRVPLELDIARLALYATLVVLLAGFVAFSLYLGWHQTLDDAAISFAYSKNLVHGHGLVLTPGAEKVEGYSNFLWVLVMAPVIAVGLDAIAAAKVIGLALSVAAIALLARVPGLVERRQVRWLDLLAPALAVASLPFALWAVSGMENALEAFLLVAVVVLSIRELDSPKALPWSALPFFALALTRPEGVAFWFAAVGHRVALTAFGRRAFRQDALWLVACLLPLALYHVWHYLYFGELVPNTYFAKAEDRSLGDMFDYLRNRDDPGVLYLRSFLDDYRIVFFAPLAVLSLASRRGLTYYSLPFLLVLTGCASAVFAGGDWMQYHRFFSPLVPLFYLTVQEGVRVTAHAAARVMPRQRAILPTAFAAVLAALLLTIAARASIANIHDAHEQPYGAYYSTILASGQYLDSIGEQVGIERPVVLTADIGGAAYGTDISVVDLAGLADKYIARHPRGEALGEYIFGDRRPDIIWLHDPWVGRSAIDRDPRLFSDYVAYAANRNQAGELTYGVFIRNDLLLPQKDCQGAVPWDRAGFHVGELTTVIGPAGAVRRARGGWAALDIVGQRKFSIILTDDVLARLGMPPGQAFSGKTVCVRGVVESVQGTLRLTPLVPGSIVVVGTSPSP